MSTEPKLRAVRALPNSPFVLLSSGSAARRRVRRSPRRALPWEARPARPRRHGRIGPPITDRLSGTEARRGGRPASSRPIVPVAALASSSRFACWCTIGTRRFRTWPPIMPINDETVHCQRLAVQPDPLEYARFAVSRRCCLGSPGAVGRRRQRRSNIFSALPTLARVPQGLKRRVAQRPAQIALGLLGVHDDQVADRPRPRAAWRASRTAAAGR